MTPLNRTLLAGGVGLLALAALAPAVQAAPAPGWRIANSTALPEGYNAYMNDVTATSAKAGWAVGYSQEVGEPSGMLLKRWNGSRWTEVKVPAGLAPRPSAELWRVAASAWNNVWAFGIASKDEHDTGVAFGVHWDGAKWTRKIFPKMQGISQAASIGPRGQVLLIGHGECKRWWCKPYAQSFDGKNWKAFPVPAGIGEIHARSAKDIWATVNLADGRKTPAPKNTLAHWDGRKWRTIPQPKLGLTAKRIWVFSDIYGTSSKSAWVSVASFNMVDGYMPGAYLGHWDGKKWRTAKVNSKDCLRQIATDGHGGLWARSWDDYLVHYSRGKVTARIRAPRGSGEWPNVVSLAHVPGTSSMWATGNARNKGVWDTGVIWKYGA
ncbi:hypothetical protein J4573_46405 [Actinomadura barringtoniae]|uniref:Uncharacterized protein n=1 Tax=Actinomadura barringtoniae TaxID=1427535 RepID=A0A939PR09_9ACTN|nr:hypothetical protein [Actinomadura barringtoniae]MBO2454589.1 hypothetical protein [Actinomadura barringtoniae]